jgi:hypothetical protein
MSGGADGVEIPKGDPDAIRAAGSAWDGLAEVIGEHRATLTHASGTVVGADWNGPASLAYQGAAFLAGSQLGEVGEGLREAADAARTFAKQLHRAQHDARAAQKRARRALDMIDDAKRRLEDAQGRRTTAEGLAGAASDSMLRAGAAGPAGEAFRAQAQAEYDTAMRAADTARADEQRATDDLREAERELRDAQREGREANREAEDAAKTAAGEWSGVAGAMRAPDVGIGAPVPVSLREAGADLSGFGAAAGLPAWLTAPGRYATPGHARAAQIARLAAAQPAHRAPLNGLQKAGQKMMTAGSSVADVFTFGGASKLLETAAGDDRAVDQDSGLYTWLHGGTDAVSMATGVGMLKHAAEKGAKELAEELVQKGADNAARSASAVVDRGRRIVSGAVPAFDKAKVPYTQHFADRVALRGARGVTGQSALEAYNSGTKFYDETTKAFIRYDRKTGVAVVMRDGINGPVHTAFQQPRPAVKWNPIPYGSGR